MRAFESSDVVGVVGLLTNDVRFMLRPGQFERFGLPRRLGDLEGGVLGSISAVPRRLVMPSEPWRGSILKGEKDNRGAKVENAADVVAESCWVVPLEDEAG